MDVEIFMKEAKKVETVIEMMQSCQNKCSLDFNKMILSESKIATKGTKMNSDETLQSQLCFTSCACKSFEVYQMLSHIESQNPDLF
mmetsp:Transcript_24597/g.28281  ORF Transcript_24597/g.28281 Transcript_24597/m.28281 type:complete len:86 (+) Transcript_24597:75-332(+)